jgi:hypothetical protein
VLVCLLGGPDDTCGGARGVETCVRLVAFVRLAELPVDAGAEFCGCQCVLCLNVRLGLEGSWSLENEDGFATPNSSSRSLAKFNCHES